MHQRGMWRLGKRVLLLSILVVFFGFVTSIPQTTAKASDDWCYFEPYQCLPCPEPYHCDHWACVCVCDCPDMYGGCPSACAR